MSKHFALKSTDSGEKGIALITVTLILAIMAVIGITVANTSIIENWISSNYRTSKEAFYDAEAGVHYALACIDNDLTEKEITVNDLENQFSLGERYLASRPEGFNFSYPSDPLQKLSNYKFCFDSAGHKPSDANAQAKIKACFTVEYIPVTAFRKGIVSEGDITINGAPNIKGSLHANGNIEQNGEGTIEGDVTAVGSVDIDSNVDEDKYTVQDNADYIDIPKISEDDFESWKLDADTIYPEPDSSDEGGPEYSIDLDGDLQDQMIFVDGNVTIKNNTKVSNNTIIIATGDVTFRGESTFEEGDDPEDEGFEINTAVIAGGNVLFNGSGDSYGIFWCNGDFTRNGANYVHGSIVAAHGVKDPDITFDGEFEFEYFDKVNDNLPIPKVPTVKEILHWADQSLS